MSTSILRTTKIHISHWNFHTKFICRMTNRTEPYISQRHITSITMDDNCRTTTKSAPHILQHNCFDASMQLNRNGPHSTHLIRTIPLCPPLASSHILITKRPCNCSHFHLHLNFTISIKILNKLFDSNLNVPGLCKSIFSHLRIW